MIKKISKKLSANDIGITGGHQAGILVPKDPAILGFFPKLDSTIKNPRILLVVRELHDNSRWEFNFIYYNNKFFDGTRNEYRLTCMTKYLKAASAKVGDNLIFQLDENGSIYVDCERCDNINSDINEEGVLVLGSGWKVINS
ncbi:MULTISPECIES: EcoRII N-terminal effector-binding domain-containing protein [Legionella]|uniref:EcoRII N-terminal effector-binding domain-containing protein n=1 Tax=Legionella TaxID=445 RepID=UPI00058C871C|nr:MULTISPECIES: EcoRII N-terminal effector-binding domain-containing protein [Legionella]VEE02992.1 Type-2 restriction enzyme EcoRII [Legionella oakridgensis]HAT8966103.1 hypothetical protein [Legionella pneumophila subsp. pneumophila]ARB90777.1 hypothetical protein A6J40_00550 [Legionella longbeachae]MDW9120407.1 EcoRII N-terminal effector-binding domain-containing protein [Legionella pneumophila]RZV22651.1 hypothetical protein EKG34_14645 [Legionella longbeachae]